MTKSKILYFLGHKTPSQKGNKSCLALEGTCGGFFYHKHKTGYLKSSTLIEVVVAMIMITVFTGIFFNFITKMRKVNLNISLISL